MGGIGGGPSACGGGITTDAGLGGKGPLQSSYFKKKRVPGGGAVPSPKFSAINAMFIAILPPIGSHKTFSWALLNSCNPWSKALPSTFFAEQTSSLT